jgi:hypothetical protein
MSQVRPGGRLRMLVEPAAISTVIGDMAGWSLPAWSIGGVLDADKTGMGHSGRGGKALMRSRSAGLVVPRGRPADRSQASRCGSRISGQAAPGSVR